MKRWLNPQMLQYDRKKALEFVEVQGIKICYDEYERNYAKSIFSQINFIFAKEILNSTLSLIYLYDQEKQPPNIARCDGYSSISERLNSGRRVSSVGISLQALHYNKEYAVMIFLHELTHILYKTEREHDAKFHNHLDKLIERYNQATGEKVKNDYFGLSGAEGRETQ